MNSAHFGFIFAAYAVTGLAVLAMIGAVVLDHRALQRALASLAARTPATRNENQ